MSRQPKLYLPPGRTWHWPTAEDPDRRLRSTEDGLFHMRGDNPFRLRPFLHDLEVDPGDARNTLLEQGARECTQRTFYTSRTMAGAKLTIPHGDDRVHHLEVKSLPLPNGEDQYFVVTSCPVCQDSLFGGGVIQDPAYLRGPFPRSSLSEAIRERRATCRWSLDPNVLPYDEEEWEAIQGARERGAEANEERRALAELHERRARDAALLQSRR